MNYIILVLRLNDNTMQFQNTELYKKVYSFDEVRDILLERYATEKQVNDVLNLNLNEFTFIETTNENKRWFISVSTF